MNRSNNKQDTGMLLAGIVGACVLVWQAIFGAAARADPPGPDQAEEWVQYYNPYDGRVIVNVTVPDQNSYRTINSVFACTATASDLDCYRVGQTYYSFNDDVTTGDTDQQHHMVWSVTGDSGVNQFGTITDQWGTTGEYSAPDYSDAAGQDVRRAYLKATADDNNLAGDTYGYNDTLARQDSHTVNVWQVQLSVSYEDGQGYYDGPAFTAMFGAYQHGWVQPGQPANALFYCGNTRLIGAIPDSVPIYTDYAWYQAKSGTIKYQLLVILWYTSVPSQK